MAHLLRHPTQAVHYHFLKLMQACWPTVPRDQAMELSIKDPSLRPRALGTQELYSKVRITNWKLRVTLTLKSIHKIALIVHVFVTFHVFIGSIIDNFVWNVCTNRFKITTFRFTACMVFTALGSTALLPCLCFVRLNPFFFSCFCRLFVVCVGQSRYDTTNLFITVICITS